ncbi:MAG: hypothetical protein OES10_10455 [Gammaproteobacteria bacterium]|nr:hypothetical protein [Gammaproteobacteria bacterium]
MMTRMQQLAVATSFLLTLCVAAGAAEPPRLTHNPFTRPPSQVTIPDRLLERPDGSTQELDLRATLVASRDKLANVAGKILRPGDEVHGYTLLQVFEDRAVFTREGNQLTIYVKPNLEQDDE